MLAVREQSFFALAHHITRIFQRFHIGQQSTMAIVDDSNHNRISMMLDHLYRIKVLAITLLCTVEINRARRKKQKYVNILFIVESRSMKLCGYIRRNTYILIIVIIMTKC